MSEERYDIVKEAVKLTELPESTDSKDWPLAKTLLYQENLPKLWAKICMTAAALTQNLVLNIWFLLEAVNGLRRQTGKWDANLTSQLLYQIKEMIGDLPGQDGKLVRRLTELRLYHGGQVNHSAGHFRYAAVCHAEAAEQANKAGDTSAAALSKYMEYYEMLHDYIVIRDSGLSDRFAEFEEIAQAALGQLTSSSGEDVRWRANILCHLAWFRWVVTGEVQVTDALEAIASPYLDVKPAFEGARITLLALSKLEGDPSEAVRIADQIDRNSPIDWRSYALYVWGVALLKAGEDSGASKVFSGLLLLPSQENGGHLTQALINQRHSQG